MLQWKNKNSEFLIDFAKMQWESTDFVYYISTNPCQIYIQSVLVHFAYFCLGMYKAWLLYIYPMHRLLLFSQSRYLKPQKVNQTMRKFSSPLFFFLPFIPFCRSDFSRLQWHIGDKIWETLFRCPQDRLN